jgi:hypothetical protein
MTALLAVLFHIAAYPQRSTGDYAYLKQQFAQPDKQYGSAPLWVWNTTITHSLIDTMLQGFRDKGFGGVFVHPRPGLVTEYLGNDWFSNWQYALQKAKQLGLEIWIYDENSYPSGFAGGHVPAQMPSSWNQGQMLHMTKVSALPDTADRFYCVLKEQANGFEDLTGRTAAEKGRKGAYYLFSKEFYERTDWYGGYSYVDLMVKGVTEKFIELTMSGYEKTVGNEFGKALKGVFSDEPNIETQGPGNIRWTPVLFTRFQQDWGYDLKTALPSLFEETGNWKKVRHDYYQTLLQLFIDGWSKPWYAYTEKKGLEWTGHYWEHAWPNPNHGGDNMAMYAWHQRPGIDLLFNQFDEKSPNAQFGNIRAVKELASVANQLGKKRTLCEIYGGGGWELTFMDMKRLGDWSYVLGVNTMNQHLAYMTINGARKYDYPQSFSYHNPWWAHYRPLNRYFARLSMALSRGRQQNDILVLEPTTSAWMYVSPTHANARFGEIAHQFQHFVTQLERMQVEYDLGSENIIKDHGKISGGKFVVGERAYATVIIPPGTDNLDSATFQLLRQYTDAGGKVLMMQTPQLVDGAAASALTDWLQRTHLQPMDAQQVIAALPDAGIAFPQLDTAKGKLYHHRRQLEDGQLVFLSNASMDEQVSGQLRLKGKQALLMDLNTGKMMDYPAAAGGETLTLQYDLPPAGSMLFFVTDRAVHTGNTYTPPPSAGPVATAASEIRRLQPNVLTIDFCDVQLGDNVFKDQHVYNAADKAFKYFGFKNGNPWNTSVQYKRNIVDRDTFNAHSRVTARYHFTLGNGVDTKGLQAVVERPSTWKVKLNGHALAPVKGRWWLDKTFAVYDIAAAAQPGLNTLEISASPMSIFAEIEPVYVLGNFSLRSEQQGFSIQAPAALQPGSWKEQGMPLYGHEVAYRKQFSAKPGAGYQVKLEKWKGTVAAVKVNGKDAGIIDIPPYTLDISSYVKPGNNTVEVMVTGSLKNTLGPHHNTPRPGLVSPWLWRNVKSYPSGRSYDVYDYGLLTDFSIMNYNK